MLMAPAMLLQLGQGIAEPLHHSQHSCSSQPGRHLGYQPPPGDATPCNLNERTCTKHFARTSMGSNVTVTYSWKHFMYEDQDRALFNSWQQRGGPQHVIVSAGAFLRVLAPENGTTSRRALGESCDWPGRSREPILSHSQAKGAHVSA